MKNDLAICAIVGEWEARRLYKADACGNRIDTYKLERWYKNLEDSYAKEKC